MTREEQELPIVVPIRRSFCLSTKFGLGLAIALAVLLPVAMMGVASRWEQPFAGLNYAPVIAFLLVGAILPALSWARRQPPRERIWRGLVYRLLLTPLGIYLPLFVYLLSPFALNPEWKGDARFGWFSMTPATGWAWMPAVVWASVALYVGECLDRAKRRAWVTLGLLSGTIASTFLSAVLMVHLVAGGLPSVGEGGEPWCLVPFGTALLYGLSFLKRWSRDAVDPKPLVTTLSLNLGLLAVNLALAKHQFDRLPDARPPGCYVVTAAARGHECLVRPLGAAGYGDGFIKVNRQLLILWELENRWRTRWPVSHRLVRRLYNRLGPLLARRITTPLRADLVYLAVKPLEWLAATILARPDLRGQG